MVSLVEELILKEDKQQTDRCGVGIKVLLTTVKVKSKSLIYAFFLLWTGNVGKDDLLVDFDPPILHNIARPVIDVQVPDDIH